MLIQAFHYKRPVVSKTLYKDPPVTDSLARILGFTFSLQQEPFLFTYSGNVLANGLADDQDGEMGRTYRSGAL